MKKLRHREVRAANKWQGISLGGLHTETTLLLSTRCHLYGYFVNCRKG